MNIILLADVPRLGRKDDLVTVSEAYARNYLLPKKLARPADARSVAGVKQRQAAVKAQMERRAAERRRTQQMLVGRTMTLTAPGNDRGRLFAAVRLSDVLRVLPPEVSVDPDGLTMTPPTIKDRGQHEITLRWPDGQTTTLTLIVDTTGVARG